MELRAGLRQACAAPADEVMDMVAGGSLNQRSGVTGSGRRTRLALRSPSDRDRGARARGGTIGLSCDSASVKARRGRRVRERQRRQDQEEGSSKVMDRR